MDKKTLEALKGSIKKWYKIAYEDGEDIGTDNCPLCKLFYTDYGCGNCPVAEKTGEWGCRETPYDEWSKHHDDKPHSFAYPLKAECPECKEIAIKEYEFLKSLLPEGE